MCDHESGLNTRGPLGELGLSMRPGGYQKIPGGRICHLMLVVSALGHCKDLAKNNAVSIPGRMHSRGPNDSEGTSRRSVNLSCSFRRSSDSTGWLPLTP